MATRSRRRQRNPTADNTLAQQPKPKRQRVPAAESTSTAAATSTTTTEAQSSQAEMIEVKHDTVARLPSKPDGMDYSAPASRTFRRDVPVRSKKPKQGERTSKSDGSVELVSCAQTLITAL